MRAVRPVAVMLGMLLLVTLSSWAQVGPPLRRGQFAITEADRTWWAFQPLKPIELSANGKPEGAIDQLISLELSQKGVNMNPPATPRELVRRATFDLLGLPPSAEDVRNFTAEPTDDAWSRLIDRLLASEQYGERWGRHWLDLVRYAESNGYERDGAKPHAWRYRDYVIRSFNEDKPYDRFIREQLAGDELAEAIVRENPAQRDAWEQPLIATGFYRLHVWDDEPDSTVAAEYDDFDDILVTTSTAFLGVTLGCARCHDHKYDPFSQADYYSMLSFFRGIDPYGLHKTGGGGRGTGKIERPLVTPEEWANWQSTKKGRLQELELRVSAAADAEAKKRAEEELDRARRDQGPFNYSLAVAENGPTARPTHILARGDPSSPRAEVSPSFPAILGGGAITVPSRTKDAATCGRRGLLADWIASAQNPLTARVKVNRIWQHHFGVGIVATVDDFGRTGMAPTNPALLDYLANEFVRSGWSIKRMHKIIMTSRAYRLSSSPDNERGRALDEANTLFWRQNLRRLEAEAVRDTILAVSGTLNLKQGGPSVYPTLPAEVHRTQDSAGKGWVDSPTDEQNRRSVYLVVKRALKVPMLDCFDFANSTSASGTRPMTTTAPQALMLLNDFFVQTQAEHFWRRLQRESMGNIESQIARAFSVALQRAPTDWERARSSEMIRQQEKSLAPKENAHDLAMVSFCHAMLNLNEFIYID